MPPPPTLSLSTAITVANPETGEALDLSPEEATNAVASGSVDLDGDREYHVEAPDGSVVTVPATSVAEAVSLGGRLITEDDVARRREVEAQSGDLASSALAFTNAAFSGGLSLYEQDLKTRGGVMRNIGNVITGRPTQLLPEARTVNTATEANPGAATAGELASYAAAAAPGIAAENALVRMATAEGGSALRNLGTRALARGVVGAGENIAIGRVQQFGEIASGREQPTAENLLAAMGRDALIGSVANAGMGGLVDAGAAATGLLRRGASRVSGVFARGRDAVAEAFQQQTGVPLRDGVADVVAETYGKVVGRVSGDLEAGATTARLASRTPEGRAARAVINRGDAVIEDGARALRRAGDAAERDARPIMEIAQGEGKASRMAKLARGMSLDTAFDESASLLSQARAHFEDILSKPHIAGAQLAAESGIGVVKQAEDLIERAVIAGDKDAVGRIFIEMDRAKRRIQKEIAQTSQMSEWFPGLENLQRRFINHLEDTRIYGAAATAQAETNAMWTKFLGNNLKFRNTFMTKIGNEGFRPVYTFDPGKAARHLENVGKARNDIAEEVLGSHFKNQDNLLDAIAKHYDLEPEMVAQLKKARSSSKEIGAELQKRLADVETLNQYKYLKDMQKEGVGSTAVGYAAGALGPVGLVGAAAYKAVSSPATMIRLMAQLEKRNIQVGKWITRSAKDALGPTSARLARVQERAGRVIERARSVGRTAGKAAQLAARTYARPALAEHYSARMERLKADASEKKHEQVAANIRPFAPGVAQAAAQTAARADAFLQSKIPTGALPSNTLQPHLTRPRVSDAEMSKFLRYARAVDEPLTVIEDLADGALTREGVEAVRAVYPSLFSAMQTAVMTAVTESTEALAYDKRVQIGLLLDVPTDPSLAPAAIVALQSAYKSPNKLAPPPARLSAPKMSAALLTDTQRVAST